MTYFAQAKKKQKDLYIKKSLTVHNSTTHWSIKQPVMFKRVIIDLNTSPSGSGTTSIVIYKNRGRSSQQTIFTGNFSSGETTKSSSYNLDIKINEGDAITYSVASTTSGNPGGNAIIHFIYENA